MNSLYSYIHFLRELTKLLMKYNYNYVLFYTFVQYALFRLKTLTDTKYNWIILSDLILKNLIEQFYNKKNYYIDCNSCLLANIKYVRNTTPTWFYICSTVSIKKYKVLVVPLNNTDEIEIFTSNIMKYNIENALHCTIDKCFLLPTKDDTINFAREAKISMISNQYEITDNLISTLLENYFSEPRFLRKNDLFGINIKEYIMEHMYLHTNPLLSVIYFKVNSIINDNRDFTDSDTSYILYGETTLIQEPDIHSYLPQKHFIYNQTKQKYVNSYPSSLAAPLEQLERCILPFIKHDIQLSIKPIFLIKGAQGSNKHKLVQILAEKIGLNFLNTDFAEVQALISAQTEAKLRIVLRNAEQSVPCILCLNNIEVFGRNSEGQKDERVISAFSNEINSLYNKHLKYPIIIVATTNESDIPAELNRIFIETIHVEHLDQNERTNLVSWLLMKRNLNHQVNLSKISGICSDFRYSDLSTLILNAVKFHCRDSTKNLKPLTLLQEDFDKAYEYMQSVYTDCKGAPRVPKVYWEDIGGLMKLKHEIMRRIQLPLMNTLGFGQSGLLLYGPPGTGKTLLAKAVATEYQLHFLSIKGPEVLNMYVGQSEKNVRQVFERARAAAPCIIFFDELDSLAPNRGRSGDSGGVMDRVVSQLLAEMDGLDCSSSIFIIGATNRPDLIDPALLRPGRFDKLLYVGIHSDRDSQFNVLKALTRKFKFHENGEELEKLIYQLPEHTTGADLYSICSNAWLNAARRVLSNYHDNSNEIKLDEYVGVELEDFLKAAHELIPSVSKEEAERYKKMQIELSSVS
ncbi:peroxisome assembly factor 2 isoform X1 [Bombus pyrosoma]|uniref:peroxisome assembly factor 2 isoform X1 n=1 Tax=Bombus pyrosoma TaxID=396416 RepID=UPI001CB8EBC3|nr:peroxisome assembly factor 2 isoform X1 [Bombus pyrosoma]